VPFALFALALISLVFAVSRPVSIISVPSNQTTIVLVLDVSGSMCQTDIEPSRLKAAEAAMLSFIEQQGGNTQIGLVAFSGFAAIIQPPTSDPEALQTAIESLQTGRRTAIGSGLLNGLDAIAEVDPNVAPSTNEYSPEAEPTPVPRGAYAPDIIVLLTDGVSNAGPDPVDAAQQAVTRGVRVYTIGFGTANGAEFSQGCGPQFRGGGGQFGGGQFGGGGPGGGGFRRGIDEAMLQQVADLTGGTYHSAESADELQSVFANLPTYLIMKHETTEISVVFAAIGALLAALAIALALLWQPLP
jgi:Ca-activated chloride channel family protein